MRLFVQNGDRAGAILAFEAYAHRLRREFDLDPSDETLSLLGELRDGSGQGAPLAQGASMNRATRGGTVTEPQGLRAGTRGPGRSLHSRWLLWAGVAAAVVLAVSLAIQREAGTASTRFTPSTSVAEFMTLDGQSAEFAASLTDDLLTRLSTVRGLTVLPLTNAEPQGDRSEDLALARGADLGTIVRGSVLRTEQGFTWTVELVETDSEQALWAHTYDTEIDRLVAVQADAAIRITEALGVPLLLRDEGNLRASSIPEPTAWEYMERALHLSRVDRRPAATEQSIELLNKAIDLEPDFAEPRVLLAFIRDRDAEGAPPPEAHDTVFATVANAAHKDPESALIQHILSLVLRNRGHYADGLEAELRAVELDPSYANAIGGVGVLYGMMGRMDRSGLWGARSNLWRAADRREQFARLSDVKFFMGQYDQAKSAIQSLNELYPEGCGRCITLAQIQVATGRLDEARATLGDGLATDPESTESATWRGWMSIHTGDFADAVQWLEAALTGEPALSSHRVGARVTSTLLAYAHLQLGDSATAYPLLDQSERYDRELWDRRMGWYLPPYDLARVYALRGDVDEALSWVRKSIRVGWAWFYHNQGPNDPLLANIHDHPEFIAMMEEVRGLIDEQRIRLESRASPVPSDAEFEQMKVDAWEFAEELRRIEDEWGR
jgi:TolB-like protein/Flp pilus assembly protein TadD